MKREVPCPTLIVSCGTVFSILLLSYLSRRATLTRHFTPARLRLVASSGADVHEWKRNVDDELKFWDEWFRTKGLEWPEVYSERIKAREIGDDIKATITDEAKWSGRTLRILDAGAGPLTVLGNQWAGKDVEVHAADALAHEFDRILARHEIVPPVRTIKADFENLSSKFPENYFDLVYVRNALDQAYDPVKGIGDALAVTRLHGVMQMSHVLRNALLSHNKGLHLWNFDVMGGDPVIWNCRGTHNLTDLFGEEAQITHEVVNGWINIRMLKLT
jgi:Methyltransferase domain